jgi:UDP-glucose 4-epimerase
VTGGSGFVGSHLVDRLLEEGHTVHAIDNESTGFPEFLQAAIRHPRFSYTKLDLLSPEPLRASMEGADIVFHMAANADVRFGTAHPARDLQQNTIATFNVLEAMRQAGARRIVFPSTGSVYGEPSVFPTPEDAPFPIQTSLYGASKLAAEGLIAAYCEGFGFQGWIFRFVSVLGARYTHGHVFDFYKKLAADPNRLHVLGNGRQRKSYMHVYDCINGMLLAIERARDRVNVLNLGTDAYIEVTQSVAWIAEHLGITPTISYEEGARGWIGDSPFIYLDVRRMRSLGWEASRTIREGVVDTLRWLQANEWILSARV